MAERNELTGYADPLVARPGDTVRVMVSTSAESYESEIVRLIHGDNNPQGPGFKAERVETSVNGSYPGRHQETRMGSYALIPSDESLDRGGGLTLQAWIWPTTPELDEPQGIMSRADAGRGYRLILQAGALIFQVGHSSIITPHRNRRSTMVFCGRHLRCR